MDAHSGRTSAIRGSVSVGAYPLFAAVDGGSLELRAIATGRVVEVLGRVGQSWTDNGFAFSGDGRDVYMTLIPKPRGWRSLLLEQVSLSTRRRQLIGRGEQPAVSPDNRLLAYASGEGRSAEVVVRERGSGQSRSISISRLLGRQTDLLNASLAWLGNGTQLAVIEWCCAVAVGADPKEDRPPGPGGRPGQAVLRLIVVSRSRDGRLTAKRVLLPAGAQIPESLGTDMTHPGSLMVSWLGPGDRATVDRLRIRGPRANLTTVLTIARAQVLSFDPTGQRLLYIMGHRPPNLWTANINGHRLRGRHLLLHNSTVSPVAW
jgi:hypothetical protein